MTNRTREGSYFVLSDAGSLLMERVKTASPKNDISGFFSKLPQIIALKKTLGHTFRDRNLLLHAFAHASFVHENPDLVDQSYERMEFLGDAILGAVVTESLFHLHSDMDEGHASKMKRPSIH